MKNTKTKIMALAASAALVAMLGLAACGGGSSSAASSAASSSAASSAASSSAASSSTTASSSSAAASSAATSASTAATSSAATSASAAATSTSAAATTPAAPAVSSEAAAEVQEQYADVDLFGYVGVSSANEYYYLAMDAQATYGILVIMDENGRYLSFVGPMSTEGTMFQIVDESTGDSFGFEMTAADNGAYLFDAGDAGQIVLAETDVNDVFKALAAIDYAGTAVN